MVSSAMTPATMASTGTGARRMSTNTIGISTTAVATRLSKGSVVAGKVGGAIITRGMSEVAFSSAYLCVPGGLGFHGFSGCMRVMMIKPAVAALPLLVFGNAFEQM